MMSLDGSVNHLANREIGQKTSQSTAKTFEPLLLEPVRTSPGAKYPSTMSMSWKTTPALSAWGNWPMAGARSRWSSRMARSPSALAAP